MIRVLLALEHTLLRAGVMQVLETCDDIKVAAECHGAAELRGSVLGARPDVVMAGVRSLDVILEAAPEQRVLVLGEHCEEGAAQVLRRGAAGYMGKDCAVTELSRLVRLVHAGQRVICIGAEPVLLESSGPALRLSTRELQVLRLLAMGEGLEGVARALDLSPSTVKTYRQRLQEKLGVSERAALVRFAMQHGLLH